MLNSNKNGLIKSVYPTIPIIDTTFIEKINYFWFIIKN